MFDITLSPLLLEAGQEQMELPGLLVAAAPRKAARLRVKDQLVLYMRLSGSSSLTSAQQQEILAKLAETYFTSSGPITTGLRAVVVRLNDFLLNRNLRGAREGQAVGVLNLAAIHSGSLLLAHGGSTHTFLIGKKGVQHFHDSLGVRGLGLGKQIIPRFFQAPIEAGDILTFSSDPPASWTDKALAGAAAGGMEQARRRLLSQAGMNLHAGMARLQTGKGQVSWYKPTHPERAASPDRQPVILKKETEAPQAAAAPSLIETGKPTVENLPKEDTFSDIIDKDAGEPFLPVDMEAQDEPSTVEPLAAVPSDAAEHPPGGNGQPAGAPAAFHTLHGVEITPRAPESASPAADQPSTASQRLKPGRPAAQVAAEVPAVPQKPEKAKRKPAPAPKVRRPGVPNPVLVKVGKGMSAALSAGAAARAKAGQAARSASAKVFPHRAEPFFSLSPAAMLGIALFVPLLVVSVAVAVYMNSGRSEQMALNLYYAQQYAERAMQQADPKARRDDLNQVVLWVREANKMGESEQGKTLHLQAQTALDEMDGVVRVDFRPVIPGGLGAETHITRMVATINDAYLLDSSQGRILRLYRTGSGYDIDPGFACGPGKAGGQIIGPLVGMATLPPNNEYRATILGIDAAGNLVYCSPNQSGYDSRPLTPPDAGWGKIMAMTSYGGTLYVLDPQFNAVYYYSGNNGVYEQRPRLFFDSQVPQMDDIVDFAVDQEFLYLLHEDGRITLCEGSGFEFQPTRCTDPAPYGDNRVGRTPAPLRFEDARFVQVQSTQPPDPSLFFLDDAGQAVYHFSLRRLNYQRQYRQFIDPDYPFPKGQPTAFAITPNRRILVAFQNQVFFGAIP